MSNLIGLSVQANSKTRNVDRHAI